MCVYMSVSVPGGAGAATVGKNKNIKTLSFLFKTEWSSRNLVQLNILTSPTANNEQQTCHIWVTRASSSVFMLMLYVVEADKTNTLKYSY